MPARGSTARVQRRQPARKQDDAAMIAGEKKSPGHVGRLPLGALRTGYFMAARQLDLV